MTSIKIVRHTGDRMVSVYRGSRHLGLVLPILRRSDEIILGYTAASHYHEQIKLPTEESAIDYLLRSAP